MGVAAATARFPLSARQTFYVLIDVYAVGNGCRSRLPSLEPKDLGCRYDIYRRKYDLERA